MEQPRSLPFKAGHLVEEKSFLRGYRGAWFRCEIKKIDGKGVHLKYYDFPDQEITPMKSMYQKVPGKSKGRRKGELMLRPQFPPIYRQGETPDINTLSEVIVVTNVVWKVGDLVDWFCDGAYWSGTITEIREDDKVQVDLPPLPLGEGLTYEALCKDLRPSLEWSQKSGWKVPTPEGSGGSYCPCAQLIQPINQEKLGNEGKENSETAQEITSELNASASRSSDHSLPCLPRLQSREKVVEEERRGRGEKRDADALESGFGKGSYSDSVSSSTYVRASGDVGGCKEDAPENETSKRISLEKKIPLNSSTCDSIESLMVDLEELLNRIKWMKTILEPPESNKAAWKFQEYREAGNRSL